MITITVNIESSEEALRLARMFEAYAGAPRVQTGITTHIDVRPLTRETYPLAASEDRAAAGAGDVAYADFVTRGAAEPIRLYPVPAEGVTTAVVEPQPDGVDARGIPWDARIHSSSQKLTDKGVWQRRRNVSDELVAQVEAELVAAAEAPVAEPQPETAAAADYDPEHTSTAALAVVVPPPPTFDPIVPPPPAVPADPRAHWPKTAKELMPLLVKGMSEGKFTVEHLNAACQAVGVENFNGFNSRPDLIPSLIEELNLEIA